MNFCRTCGSRLARTSQFCTRCAARQRENSADPSVAAQLGTLPSDTAPPDILPDAEADRQPTRWLPRSWVTIALTAVVVASVSALLSWRLTAGPAAAAPQGVAPGTARVTAPVRSPAPPAGASTFTAAPPAGASTSTAAPPAGASTSTAAPPAGTNGPVPVSPGVAQQTIAGQVAAFLGTYFAAINDHDYQTYIGLFDESAQPDRSAEQFLSSFGTTNDSDPLLVALTPTATGEWAATVTFISHQSPAASAINSSCTSWNITFYLEPSGSSYLIGLPPPGYRASSAGC
jgi:hypothetical protein